MNTNAFDKRVRVTKNKKYIVRPSNTAHTGSSDSPVKKMRRGRTNLVDKTTVKVIKRII